MAMVVVFGKLWYPDGKNRNTSSGHSSVHNSRKRLKLVKDDGPLRIDIPKDNRQWSVLHREVADVGNKTLPSLLNLTPPQADLVNVKGPGGLTPLMLAVSRENDENMEAKVVGELIKYGAELECHTDITKETALHLAARCMHKDATKLLIDAGAEINAVETTGRTPLHLAVTANAQEVFQILLRQRATKIDAKSDDGTTALIYAVRFMADTLLENLIKAGAQVNLTDIQGRTALHWAASVGNDKATEILLKNSAKIDTQDSNGQTPLFLASKEGRVTIIEILLSFFAKQNIVDNFGQSPLDVATQLKNTDIVETLSHSLLNRNLPTSVPAKTASSNLLSYWLPGPNLTTFVSAQTSPCLEAFPVNARTRSITEKHHEEKENAKKRRICTRTEEETQSVMSGCEMLPNTICPYVLQDGVISHFQEQSSFIFSSHSCEKSVSTSFQDGMSTQNVEIMASGMLNEWFYSMTEDARCRNQLNNKVESTTENQSTWYLCLDDEKHNKNCMYAN